MAPYLVRLADVGALLGKLLSKLGEFLWQQVGTRIKVVPGLVAAGVSKRLELSFSLPHKSNNSLLRKEGAHAVQKGRQGPLACQIPHARESVHALPHPEGAKGITSLAHAREPHHLAEKQKKRDTHKVSEGSEGRFSTVLVPEVWMCPWWFPSTLVPALPWPCAPTPPCHGHGSGSHT